MSRTRAILIAIDQLIAAITLSWPKATLSAWAWVWENSYPKKRVWPRKMIDTIFFWDEKHCYNSWISELEHLHYPDGFLDPVLFILE